MAIDSGRPRRTGWIRVVLGLLLLLVVGLPLVLCIGGAGWLGDTLMEEDYELED